MHIFLKTAMAAIFSSVVAIPAAATTLSISYTGTVTSTNDAANNATSALGGISTGEAVVGSFLLDTAALATSTLPTQTSYANAVTAFTLSLDDFVYTSNTSETFRVRNNDMAGSSAPLRDSVLFSSTDVSGPDQGGVAPSIIQFALGGTDTSILSNGDIPTPAVFQQLFAADNIGGNLNFLSVAGSEARFSIDTLTIGQVPLPAGLPLLMAGLGGFAFLRRKQSK